MLVYNHYFGVYTIEDILSKKLDGTHTGNKAVMARIPPELRSAFDAKCRELNLSQAECLRLAIKEFSASK